MRYHNHGQRSTIRRTGLASHSAVLLAVLFASTVLFKGTIANNEREDCPERGSIWYCDNPARVMDDPTVNCNWNNCRWVVGDLDPENKPSLCRAIVIVDPNTIPDFLEPCLLWEMVYGNLQPTPSPSFTTEPTISRKFLLPS